MMIPHPSEPSAWASSSSASGRGDTGWLRRLRAEGWAEFARHGLPTRKVEAWKYTDITSLAGIDFQPAAAPEVSRLPDLPPIDGWRMVFVNGGFRPDLSDAQPPEGVVVANLASLLEADPRSVESWMVRATGSLPLAALNAAFLADGLVVRVPAGRVLKRPVHLVSIGQAGKGSTAFHPRHLLALEDGAAATVVETHLGSGAYVSNGVAEIAVGAHARLRHYSIQDEAPAATHIATTMLRLDERASYEGFVLQLGARLARHELHAAIAGRGAELVVNGAYLGDGPRVVDNSLFIEHHAPGGRSRLLFKGVLADRARGVFQGRVLVERAAQKTDAYQLSRALLLSPGAEMDGKPELEIYADDVKCGHGAAVGELEDEALFYLRSRGIDERAARRLLIEAFLAETVEGVTPPAIRDVLADLLRARLTELGEAR